MLSLSELAAERCSGMKLNAQVVGCMNGERPAKMCSVNRAVFDTEFGEAISPLPQRGLIGDLQAERSEAMYRGGLLGGVAQVKPAPGRVLHEHSDHVVFPFLDQHPREIEGPRVPLAGLEGIGSRQRDVMPTNDRRHRPNHGADRRLCRASCPMRLPRRRLMSGERLGVSKAVGRP